MVSIIEQKFNKFSVNLLSEINDLIHLEVMKKQKENFRSSVLHERQKHVIKLEHDHDDLKQYGCCLCVRLEDILAKKDETKHVQIYLVIAMIVPIVSNLTINVIKPTRPATVS